MEREERACTFKPNVNQISHEIVIVIEIPNNNKL